MPLPSHYPDTELPAASRHIRLSARHPVFLLLTVCFPPPKPLFWPTTHFCSRDRMLDPLTAISLASAVVQFVDFSVKLVSAGHELYEKGSLANNNEVEQITQDIAHLAEELGAHRPPSANPPSQDEIALQQLAGSCKELAEEMMTVLETLKVQKPKSGLEIVRKALRSMRKKGKIQNIEKRLGKIREELNLRLTAILRWNFPLSQSLHR
jgi:hypothetical protein